MPSSFGIVMLTDNTCHTEMSMPFTTTFIDTKLCGALFLSPSILKRNLMTLYTHIPYQLSSLQAAHHDDVRGVSLNKHIIYTYSTDLTLV
jgi:hypothetical protein